MHGILQFFLSTRHQQSDMNASMNRATTFAIGALLLLAIEAPVRAATTMPVADAKDAGRSNFDPPLNFQPVAGCGLFENFDLVTPPVLPPGWTAINAIDPDGILWQTSDSGDPTPPSESLPNAAWVNDPDTISDKYLDSPSGTIDPVGSSALFFWNNYALEDGFDGAVLEVSIDGGPFQDILAVGGTFAKGGYNGTISTCCGNPLAGRQAWTGNSGGFITTTVNLPVSWGPSMILRWRMGSDNSVSGEGWRIDTVVIAQCHKRIPTPPRATPRPRPTPRPRLTQPALSGNWRGTNVHGPPTPTPQPRVTPHPRPPLPSATPTAHGTHKITPLPGPTLP